MFPQSIGEVGVPRAKVINSKPPHKGIEDPRISRQEIPKHGQDVQVVPRPVLSGSSPAPVQDQIRSEEKLNKARPKVQSGTRR